MGSGVAKFYCGRYHIFDFLFEGESRPARPFIFGEGKVVGKF